MTLASFFPMPWSVKQQHNSSSNVLHYLRRGTLGYDNIVKDLFYRCHKDVGKSYCHFSTHGSTVCLEIVFSVKLEGVQYKAEHFSEKFSSYRRLLGMKVFVCVAHYSDSFLLWDIRVKACDIH